MKRQSFGLRVGQWLLRRAENAVALMMLVMFVSFILQIIFRYLLNLPTGWSNELSVVMWLWLVLFGCAFVLREDEEIRLDFIYSAAPARIRRAMRIVAALSLVIAFAVSFPAIADYVGFMKVQKTAYLKIRFDWLFSIYIVFMIAMMVRYVWLGWAAIFGSRPGRRLRLRGPWPVNLASPFSLAIVAITALALCGLPIGLSMLVGSTLYLFLAHADMGTVAEQFLNGMYSNYLILAVPLFIFAAELMNSGSLTERLLRFCNALVGRFPGGLAQVNVLQAIIFAGMSGSAIADAAGPGKMMQHMMTRDGRYPASFAAALTAASAVIGPIIPPSIPMVLYALVSDASIGFLFLGGVCPAS